MCEWFKIFYINRFYEMSILNGIVYNLFLIIVLKINSYNIKVKY